jgi:AraC-like DNA-binding protein
MELLRQHRVFATSHLDEGEAFASRMWERNRSTIIEGRYGLRWNQLDIDKVSLSYIEHDCAVDLRAQGPLSDHFRLVLHHDGAMGHAVNGRHFVSHAGNAVVHAPGVDLRLDIKPFELLLVSLDGEAVRTAMARRFRKLPPYANWLGELSPTAALESLRTMTAWLAAEMERPNSPLTPPAKPRLHAERLLLSLFVECLSEAAPEDNAAAEDLSRAQVRRAEEWIDAHLTEVIGIDEVAAAAGIGVRSLQLGFRRAHGCSPQEFIIRRRLDSARHMLLEAGSDATVTAIAMTLGFFELGRFAQRYRQHFGETPSMTLARGKS